MKSIINNLLYDTNNSRLINTRQEFDTNFLSFNSRTEDLYITKNNRFFLHIAERVLDFFFIDSEEYIKPLDNSQAFDYMTKNCPDKICVYFKINDA